MKSLCLLLALLTQFAAAQSYGQLQPQASELHFTYTQMGVPMQGRFARFNATLSFDPDHPEEAHTEFEIDLASIDTGLAEVDEEVMSKDWFDVPKHPTARFVSQAVKRLGPGRYKVQGTLSIKGQMHAIVAPLTFTRSAGQGVFEGALKISRLDYRIGEGPWADVSAVADEVQVQFRLVASPN